MRAGVLHLLGITLALLLAIAAKASIATVERVSVSAIGEQTAYDCNSANISANGRFVAFVSLAPDLVPGDTNRAYDVFFRDREAGTTELVNLSSDGRQGNSGSSSPSISADGRFIAFTSNATNLVLGSINNRSQIFLRDRQEGTTECISVSTNGEEGNSDSSISALSADGRFVAFSSRASNLVPGDTNGVEDIFVRDLLRRITERVSVSSDGQQAAAVGFSPVSLSISADGRFIAFALSADNLVPGDTNGKNDIFVRDRLAGTTERVSISSLDEQGDGQSFYVSLSADGRFVAFDSDSSNFAPNHPANQFEIYIRDRLLGTTELASVSSSGEQATGSAWAPSISADGRLVAFVSWASNLIPEDTNHSTDVFVRDLQFGKTERVSVSTTGKQANIDCEKASISADGNFVTFDTASPLVPEDTNVWLDVFVVTLRDIVQPPIIGPDSLVALTSSSTQISLKWRDNSSGQSGFEIERRSGNSNFARIATLSTGTTEYANIDLTPNTAYTYRIRAVIDSRVSAYSNEASATTTGAPLTATVQITQACMSSSHNFTVVTQEWAALAGSVTVTVPFPGRIQPTLSLATPAGASTRSYTFDLSSLRVGRFTKNTRMNVTAVLTHSGHTDAQAATAAFIPLPVVTVPGILTLTGSSHFDQLERSFAQWSSVISPSITPYAASSETYQTIFAFNWGNTAGDTLVEGSEKLRLFIDNEVKSKTWADRVFIISHSRGANLTRWFLSKPIGLVTSRVSYCAGAVLACVPATGSCDAVPNSTSARVIPVTAFDLLPTWPWYRETTLQNFHFFPEANKTLNNLNNQAAPAGVPLRIIYGSGIETVNTVTLVAPGRPRVFTRVLGDGTVTEYSATGRQFTPDRRNPDKLLKMTQIKWFRGIPNDAAHYRSIAQAAHVGFMERGDVDKDIYDWLQTQ